MFKPAGQIEGMHPPTISKRLYTNTTPPPPLFPTQDEMLDLIVFNTRFISGKGIFKSFAGMVKGDYMILIFNACFLYIKL